MKLRLISVGFIAPAVITIAAVVVGLSWLPSLPATIAVHWNSAGEPDGFGAALGFLLQLGGTSIALAAMFTGIVVASVQGGPAINQKLLLVVSPLISVMLMTIALITLDAQRGLVDATAAPSPLRALIPGVLLGLVAAVAGWLLLPKTRPAENQDATTPDPTELSSTDRVLWTRSVGAPRWLFALTLVAAVLILIPSIIAPSGPSPWFWAFTLPAVALMIGTILWRVRIDNSGVVVRSFVGLPRFRVRLADIDGASVPVVNPLVEFGGWGIRFGSGRRMGVILNGGDALEVHRMNGSSLVVTVSDAEGAASLINGLVARDRLGVERR